MWSRTSLSFSSDAPRLFSSATGGRTDGGADAADLREMHEVVAGVQRDRLLERFVAPLDVMHDALELGGCRAPEEAQVRLAERGEVVESGRDVALLVAEARRPEILVVPGQLRRLVREDHAEAERPHELGVGQVLNDLPHGPLPG